MDNKQFQRLKAQINAASAAQARELQDLIKRTVSQRAGQTALARRTRQTRSDRTCPHCQSNDALLHGKDQNGRQRLKCRACRKTYNVLTGTPMARARMPEKWDQYRDCMTQRMTIREIVASGIGVNHVTAWRWRHRFQQDAAQGDAAVLSSVKRSGAGQKRT